jgi:prevent-host-death family protein
MKSISARQANQGFSELLAAVEAGEEVVITKHGRPVAVLSPFQTAALTAERQAAIDHAMEVMAKGLPWRGRLRNFARDEMHDR